MNNIFKKISIVVMFFSFFEGVRAGNIQGEGISTNSLILKEMELDPTIHFVPSPAFPPHDIAYNPNKTEYLVVWSETVDHEYLFADIYGAFVDEETGQISKSFPIVSLPKSQVEPSVSFDGNNYLVVWKDVKDIGISEIHGTLMDQDGNILIQDIEIRTRTQYRKNFIHPAVAFNGENYLVIWSGEYTVPLLSSSVRRIIAGRLVDRNGQVIGNEDIFISPFDPFFNYLCNVTSDGNNFLVSWVARHTLKIRLVYGNGLPGPDIIHLSSTLPDSGRIPTLVYGESGNQKKYLVVWTDTQGIPGRHDVYAALVNPDDIINFEIYPVAIGTNLQEFPSCTFSPTEGHF